MNREIAFPNPVDRTDLPKPRPKGKYTLLAFVIVLILGLIFLPQILSSRIGRALLKARLESQYRGTVWITGFKTAWFGPTTVQKFSLIDEQGRLIKFSELSSPISLAKLLVGHFDLGRSTITDLGIEYVIDHGDGSDTLDRLSPDWAGTIPTDAPRSRSSFNLPRISGQITLKNALFTMTRGQIQQEKQFRTVYRSVSFSSINGQIDIPSLEQKITCNFTGDVGADAQGTFAVHGSVGLAKAGKIDSATADLDIQMHNVPNALTQREAPLGWVLMPLVGAEDYAQMFGPHLNELKTRLKIDDGKMVLEDFRAQGQTQNKRPTLLAGRPTLDLISNPRRLGVAGPTSLSVDLTRGLARRLAPVHPFLIDALDGGQLQLSFSSLSMPVAGNLRVTSGRGTISVVNATLASGAVAPTDRFPRELTTQWQAVVGDAGKSVRLDIPQTPFTIDAGKVISSMPCTLDGLSVALTGTADLAGSLELSATLSLPQSMRDAGQADVARAAISGSLDQPKLDLLAPSPALSNAIRKNLEVLAERRKEALREVSSRSVQGMIEPLDQIDLSAQSTTKPADKSR
jgi:hypothetical protein